MLSEARASRLARRAGRLRHDGSSGLLARRAWRILTAAGDGGDRNAAEAVWRAWLRGPDDERWEALRRWHDPAELAEAVFAAAIEPGWPASEQEAVGAFCARRGLAPEDPVRRALFYALTGQAHQRRAADPDGSLLAAAYQAADPPTRAALRQALAGAGDLDLIRVVAAGRPGRSAELTSDERQYLTGQLAARSDWVGLWRLILDLSLGEAVSALRLFGDGWSPPDEAGRYLFGLLGHAQPDTVDAMAAEAVMRIELAAGQPVHDAQVAPDASEILVTRQATFRRVTTTRYALPDGRRIESYDTGHMSGLTHLGEAVIYVERHRGGDRLVRRGLGQNPEVLWSGDQNKYPRLARVPGGFVFATGTALWFGTAAGAGMREAALPRLGPDRQVRILWAWASEPLSGRLAIIGSGFDGHGLFKALVVLGADLQVIGQYPGSDAGGIHWLAFCGPDLLLTHSTDLLLHSWRVGTRLVPGAVTEHRVGLGMTPMPRTGHVLTRPWRQPLNWLDARTLRPVPAPPEFRSARQIHLSPDGGFAVIERDDPGLEIRDLRLGEISDLLARPMSRARPADLAAVREAGARGVRPHARQAARLLAACLEYRFGAEVMIGRNAPAIGDDGIGISRDNGGRG